MTDKISLKFFASDMKQGVGYARQRKDGTSVHYAAPFITETCFRFCATDNDQFHLGTIIYNVKQFAMHSCWLGHDIFWSRSIDLIAWRHFTEYRQQHDALNTSRWGGYDTIHLPLSSKDIQTYASNTIQLQKLLETGASNMARPLVRLEHCFYT